MDKSSRDERKELFWKLDDNGNGLLSLLETREGLELILQNKNMTKWAYGWKQAVLLSFNLAVASRKFKKSIRKKT